jgi:hypothetical protein
MTLRTGGFRQVNVRMVAGCLLLQVVSVPQLQENTQLHLYVQVDTSHMQL